MFKRGYGTCIEHRGGWGVASAGAPRRGLGARGALFASALGAPMARGNSSPPALRGALGLLDPF